MADIRREFKGREVKPVSHELEHPQETALELPAEVKQILRSSQGSGVPPVVELPEPGAPKTTPQTIQKAVENILADGLKKLYLELQPVERQAFKIKGEQTAAKIGDLLKQAKIKVQEIIRLILDWLKMLPGVSKYFLEQEAKIKAERIIKLKQ